MSLKRATILFMLPCLSISENMGDETRLINNLLKHYNTAARPVKFANTTVHVGIHFSLRNIVELDLKNEILTVNIWAFCFWRDEGLVWNPKDYNGLEVIHIPSRLLWLPDIVLTNGIRDKETTNVETNVVAQSDGNILWIPPWYLRSLCNVDVRYYPFDSQNCTLTFVPWSHSIETINMTLKFDKVDTKRYTTTAFNLEYAEQRQNNLNAYGTQYSRIELTVHFRRQVLYHSYTIIWPFVMVSILNLLIFRLSPESGEKISLGITVLLAFLVLLSIISEKMPESSKSIPLIAFYMCFVMALTNVSISFSVMVISLHNSGSDSQVPHWLKWLVLGKLSKIIRMKVPTVHSSPRRNDNLQKSIVKLVHSIGEFPSFSPSMQHQIADDIAAQNLNRRLADDENENPSCHLSPIRFNRPEKIKLMKQMLNTLRAMLYKQELNEQKQNVCTEWKSVATVLDRFFFWLFCLVTIIMSLTLLVFMPSNKNFGK